MGTILPHNAHFLRHSSGLVLADVLTSRYKVSELSPLVGLEYKQQPTFLAKKKAINNLQITDKSYFGNTIAPALSKHNINRNRATNYNPRLHTIELHRIQYPIEVPHIPAIENVLKLGKKRILIL